MLGKWICRLPKWKQLNSNQRTAHYILHIHQKYWIEAHKSLFENCAFDYMLILNIVCRIIHRIIHFFFFICILLIVWITIDNEHMQNWVAPTKMVTASKQSKETIDMLPILRFFTMSYAVLLWNFVWFLFVFASNSHIIQEYPQPTWNSEPNRTIFVLCKLQT